MNKMTAIAVSVLLLAACGDSGTPMPTPVVSASEIQRLSAEADAIAQSHMSAWPDVDAYVADLAEDVTGADPSARDSGGGKAAAVSMWKTWERLTDHTINVTGTFISADGAAYKERWPGLWPIDAGISVAAPRDPAGPSFLEVFAFEDGQISVGDVWWYADDNEKFGFGCFAVDGCPALRDTIDRYVAAWAERDAEAITALYSEDALFTDSLLGLKAEGADSIGALSDVRFGSEGDVAIEVLDVYSWTDGPGQPTPSDPDHGRLIGVAIHFRSTMTGSGGRVQELLATLELGDRYVSDLLYTHVDGDPQGLIHDEEIYHEPTSLLAVAEAEV
jgi:ketosteroid isomerase-like protein